MVPRSLLALIAAVTTVAAHGWISDIILKNHSFVGFNPTAAPWVPDQGTIAWPSWNTDTGPVYASNVSHPDIVCQINATNAKFMGTVAAGSDVVLKWTKWPDSHHGPILAYLSNCEADCFTRNKTELEWFKIAEMGQIRLGLGGGKVGYWASDQLMDNNGSWAVHIPATIRPGNYVLRHEILSLHSAYDVGGAQFYPQCINLKITGSGTESPPGVRGQQLYSAADPGVHYNIYNDESSPKYHIPGPPLSSTSLER